MGLMKPETKFRGNGGEGGPKAELSGLEKLKNRWVGWNHHQGMSLAFVMLHRLICNFKYFPIYSLFDERRLMIHRLLCFWWTRFILLKCFHWLTEVWVVADDCHFLLVAWF